MGNQAFGKLGGPGMLGKVFDKFFDKAPIAVMVRGVLERVLNPDALNTIYARAAVRQYSRELLFSSVVGLMQLVVCRIQPSVHAAYQDNREEITTSLTSVYNKLNGIDIETSRALVKEIAQQLGASAYAMKGSCQPWLPGYRVKVLDAALSRSHLKP